MLHKRAMHVRGMKLEPVRVNMLEMLTYDGNEALGAMLVTLGLGHTYSAIPVEVSNIRELADVFSSFEHSTVS